jgi:hypothetical protein
MHTLLLRATTKINYLLKMQIYFDFCSPDEPSDVPNSDLVKVEY